MTAAPSESGDVRSQVEATVLFADICGSTQLFEKYGDWQARQIESGVMDVLAGKAAEFDGAVVKIIGDAIMCRFPGPERAIEAACAMQRAINEDPALLDFEIAVKVGVHHGSVLVEQGDLYGDAVNVAARVVELAKADQIITTVDTVRQLPEDLGQMTRSLGRWWVRGKQEEVEIMEVIWQEFANLTHLVSFGHEEQSASPIFARLILEHRGRNHELIPEARMFTLGRGSKNDLVVDQESVSRTHAYIEFRQGKFILVDRSTNGTYLLLGEASRFHVQREEFVLHDQGIMCLGKAIVSTNPDLIRFMCLQT